MSVVNESNIVFFGHSMQKAVNDVIDIFTRVHEDMENTTLVIF